MKGDIRRNALNRAIKKYGVLSPALMAAILSRPAVCIDGKYMVSLTEREITYLPAKTQVYSIERTSGSPSAVAEYAGYESATAALDNIAKQNARSVELDGWGGYHWEEYLTFLPL